MFVSGGTNALLSFRENSIPLLGPDIDCI